MRLLLRMIATVLILAFVLLLSFELLLRAMYPLEHLECVDGNGEKSSFVTRSDDVLGYRLRPSLNCTSSLTKSKTFTNSRDLADTEHLYETPKDVTRILVLGDSFVQAVAVNYGERFTEKMWEGNEKVEVINAGATGYGTAQECFFLREEGLKYSPNIVILAMSTGNDGLDNVRPPIDAKLYFRLGDEGDLELARLPSNNTTLHQVAPNEFRRSSLVQLLKENSYLLRYFERKVEEIPWVRSIAVKLGIAAPGPVDLANLSIDLSYQVKLTRALVSEVVRLSAANSAKVLLVIIPTQGQVLGKPSKSAWTDADELRKMALDFEDNKTMRVLDLLPAFQDVAQKEPKIYNDYDWHFSREGHNLVAMLIIERVKDWVN